MFSFDLFSPEIEATHNYLLILAYPTLFNKSGLSFYLFLTLTKL